MTLVWASLSASMFSFFVFLYYVLEGRKARSTRKRVTEWFDQERKRERKSAIILFGDKYDNSELAEDLKKKLVQADLGVKPSEYVGICIFLFLALLFAGHFLLQLIVIINITLAYFIVWLGSKAYLKSRQNKRTESFNKQLPEICRMMSNAVKAGLTIPQGIEMVAKELKAPAGPEFQAMAQQIRLGDSFDVVMDRFRDRIASQELNIFVSTVLIQRRVGGNLAEVLDLMAGTLEERSRVNKEVSTVTAESRFVALILVVMPLMMAVMMNMFIPGFLNPLFSTWGLVLLAIFAVMQTVAYVIIRKITKIRV